MEPLTPKNSWKSPCKSICRLDKESRLCAGCWRSLDEIGSWIRYSDEEKKAATDRAALRQQEASPELVARFEKLSHANLARR